jgi:anti-sigma regulatory factor (Ser/Thr protein kinase)/serine/threonine protein phosphatase PrpC
MAQKLADISQPVIVQVDALADVRRARCAAFDLAAALGFDNSRCEEISLAVTELGTNLLRHASGGTITVTSVETDSRRGIRVESQDAGPGIADIERALTDGYSTAGGLGMGLGTVNRLMDELDFYPGKPCHRWLRPAKSLAFDRRLAFGVATRPRRHYDENGDAFLIKQWEDHALVGVIDGLGHGPFAHRASQAARQYLETHFDQPLEKLFRGTGRACRATRGVVMALSLFDFTRNVVRIANVGNIEVLLLEPAGLTSPILRRGIVGLNAPEAVVTEFPWTPKSVLILHSDGLSPRGNRSQFAPAANETVSKTAQRLLLAFGKPEDDATVVVVGNAP